MPRLLSRRSRPAAADCTVSVMVLTMGLLTFQHCQNSGTSKLHIGNPDERAIRERRRANCSGYMTQPHPTRTAAPKPPAVGT